MRLADAIMAAGMTPPRNLPQGRWLRFPGIGKGPRDDAGWCRVISPWYAVFGDWRANFKATWQDEDRPPSRAELEEARRLQEEFHRAQARRQRQAAEEALALMKSANVTTHPYLVAKGFPSLRGLVSATGELLIPVRAVEDYNRVLTVQRIAPDGTKRFLSGSRAKGGIHLLGSPKSPHVLLCEGYATGLTLQLAAKGLWTFHCIVIAFSAGNLVTVASHFPGALVCADNDVSAVGEKAARETGLPWVMPPEIGDDFNDFDRRLGPVSGRAAVREIIRTMGKPMGNPLGEGVG